VGQQLVDRDFRHVAIRIVRQELHERIVEAQLARLLELRDGHGGEHLAE